MAYAQPLANVNRIIILGASILERTFFQHRKISGQFALKNYIKHATGRAVDVVDLAVSGDALEDIIPTWEAAKSSYISSAGTLVLVHALGNTISEGGAKWSNLDTETQNSLIADYQSLIDSIEANGNIPIPINTSFRPYNPSSLNNEEDGTVAGSYLYNENVLKPVLENLNTPMGDASQPYFDYYTLTRNLYSGISDGIHPDEDLSGMLLAYTAINLGNRINGDDPLVIQRVQDPSIDQSRIKGTIKITATDDSAIIDASPLAAGQKVSQSVGEMFDSLNSIMCVESIADTVGLSNNSTFFDTGDTTQTFSNDEIKRYARFTQGSSPTLITSLSGYNPNQPVSINIFAQRNSAANDRIGEYSTTQTFDDLIKIDGSTNATSSDPEAAMNTGTLEAEADSSGNLELYFRCATGSSFAYLNAVEITPLDNVLPSVTAGPDDTATNGDTVTLTATASNYDSLLWTCTSGQSPTFSDATALNPDVTFNEVGVHVLQLEATNAEGSTTDAVTYTVEAIPNTAPTANAGADQSNISAGALVQVSASGSTDGDGTIVGYSWRETTNVGVTLSSTTEENITFTAPTSSTAQTVTLELIVTDDDGVESAPDTVNFLVNAVVVPPQPEPAKLIGTLSVTPVSYSDKLSGNNVHVVANKNSANIHKYNLKKMDSEFDLEAAGVTKIEVAEKGKVISTDAGGVTISGNTLSIEWGSLDSAGMLTPTVYAYTAENLKGEVLFGPGMNVSFIVNMMPDEREVN